MSEEPVSYISEQARALAQALRHGGGGGTSGGMDGFGPRLDKLEADMAAARVDIGVIKERLNHLPTHHEMQTAVTTSVDRAGSRTQRSVAILVGLSTLAIAAMNYLPGLIR